MRNPALIVLYALSSLFLIIGVGILVATAINNANFQLAGSASSMAEMLSVSGSDYSVNDLRAMGSARFLSAAITGASFLSLGFVVLLGALISTAVGRSSKNALREYAEQQADLGRRPAQHGG